MSPIAVSTSSSSATTSSNRLHVNKMPQPVEVTGGLIQGVPSPIAPGVTVYKGVPYAAPPVGRNRFMPPQPVIPWEGVKICDTQAPICPQAGPDPRYFNTLKGVPQSEDCLYINIFVPDPLKYPGPNPVLVWHHGGGYREGGSADPNFDGTGLAMKGVVVVVPCFRLSIFGFFAHPELSAKWPHGGSGNAGLYDCLENLKWIQANIAKLGGDPKRVNISGQSAGSAKTHILLLSPLTRGLIHGAIIQSGVRSPTEPAISNSAASYRPLAKAEAEGVALLAELGLSSVEELQDLDDIDKLTQLSLKRDTTLWGPPPFFRAVMDGHLFTQKYYTTYTTQPPNDIPIMTGQNRDEGGVYNEPRFTAEDFDECIEQRVGPNAINGIGSEANVRRFHEIYPLPDRETGKGPLTAWNDSARDHTRINISLWSKYYNLHNKSPVYGYYFTHEPPNWLGFKHDYSKPKVPGFTNGKGPLFGSYHSAEFAYTFNSLITNQIRPWTDDDRVVGDKVSTLWANFCKYGNPNGAGDDGRPAGVAEWKPLSERPDELLELGGDFQPLKIATPEAIKFWTELIDQQEPW